LLKKNIVVPIKPKKKPEKAEKYEGAYVKEPIIGLHNWVVSLDINSLYPHLIMQYSISPETLIKDSDIENRIKELETLSKEEKLQELFDLRKLQQIKKSSNVDNILTKELDLSVLKRLNLTMTPNGALYKRTSGFLPELMEKLYNERVEYKKLMLETKQKYEDTKDPNLLKDISKYNNIQMAKKISLNSAYGAIGNIWFRYYNVAIAEAITTSGQLAIRWIEKALNDYINKLLNTKDKDYIIASDTDAVYITFEDLIKKIFKKETKKEKIVNFLDKIVTEKLEPFINKSYQQLADVTNAYSQKMVMAREVIADKGIWTAKKRYILNVWDNEGVRYKKPSLKIMGIEAVKSSTPYACREKIKEALEIIMSSDEKMLNSFIQKFRDKFMNLPIEDIAYPRSVNGVSKWADSSLLWKKGTPIHVKGAILYNYLIKKHKLTKKYPNIQEGDKIKFLHIIQPNVYQCSAFSFLTKFPKELKLIENIDYDMQFEKSFVDPLKFITDKINWTIDTSYGTQITLEDFFG
jgi:DNA polymerase elongation subunit (family B)